MILDHIPGHGPPDGDRATLRSVPDARLQRKPVGRPSASTANHIRPRPMPVCPLGRVSLPWSGNRRNPPNERALLRADSQVFWEFLAGGGGLLAALAAVATLKLVLVPFELVPRHGPGA